MSRPSRISSSSKSCKTPRVLGQKRCDSSRICTRGERWIGVVLIFSIQDLEKEREEIMNVFESQLNNALEAMPSGASDGSRPSTPTESVLHSPHATGRFTRPATRDSANSVMSRFTGESKPISVLGATRGYKSLRAKSMRHEVLGDMDRAINEKGDNISSRIAVIQQKVRARFSGADG